MEELRAVKHQTGQLEEQQLKAAAAAAAGRIHPSMAAAAAAASAAADSSSDEAATAADAGAAADEIAAAAAELPINAPVMSLVIKADVQGSSEAVRDAVMAAAAGKVNLKIVYSGVGPITSTDVNLAAATGARIVSFNLRAPAPEVDAAIKAAKLEVLQHQVIYHLLDEVTAYMDAAEAGAGGATGMAEEVLGTATVLQVFPLLKNRKEAGKVAGCRVQEGSLQLNPGTVYRVLREGQVVYEGPCSNLRQHKQDVAAVGRNGECGVVLDGGRFGEFLPGDVLQCVQQRTTRGPC